MRLVIRKALPFAITAVATLVVAGIALYLFLPSYTAHTAYMADRCGIKNCCCSPFGGYCEGAGRGWYGEGKPVKSAEDASEVIRSIYLPRKVSVTNVRDEADFFEADVKENNKPLDTVIVDKRTGRIRSIY